MEEWRRRYTCLRCGAVFEPEAAAMKSVPGPIRLLQRQPYASGMVGQVYASREGGLSCRPPFFFGGDRPSRSLAHKCLRCTGALSRLRPHQSVRNDSFECPSLAFGLCSLPPGTCATGAYQNFAFPPHLPDDSTMRSAKTRTRDAILIAAKRERQERSRALVKSGERSQESMFLISKDLAKEAIVRHRVLSFS